MSSGGLAFAGDGLNTGNAGGGAPETKTRVVEALANTYYELEALGEVAEGESWQIVAYVSGADESATIVRGQLVRLLGTVSRNIGSNTLTVSQAVVNSSGNLPGFSTGVRIHDVGTNLFLQARVTNANTVTNVWRYTIDKITT